MTVQGTRQGTVTLVGTVHRSVESRERVVSAIHERDPDVVAVELDPLLFGVYRNGERLTARRLYREGATLRGVALHLVSSRRRRPVGPGGTVSEEIAPAGSDLLAAIREAEKRGAGVALVDRSFVVTLNRLAEELLSASTLRTLVGLVRRPERRGSHLDRIDGFVDALLELGLDAEERRRNPLAWFEGLTEDETAGLVSAFEAAFPVYGRIAVRERDRHIAGTLQWLREEGEDVVAVLGKGHVAGVEAYLRDPETIPESAIAAPPSPPRRPTASTPPRRRRRNTD
jgi:pheromone shutdown protein TraB